MKISGTIWAFQLKKDFSKNPSTAVTNK